jgi:antitoxin component of RelBE/YafQ-DinJ toxin-antitoxin module
MTKIINLMITRIIQLGYIPIQMIITKYPNITQEELDEILQDRVEKIKEL